jgi:hypothetical protein
MTTVRHIGGFVIIPLQIHVLWLGGIMAIKSPVLQTEQHWLMEILGTMNILPFSVACSRAQKKNRIELQGTWRITSFSGLVVVGMTWRRARIWLE